MVEATKKAGAIEIVVKKMVGKRELDTDTRQMFLSSLESYDELKITAGKPQLNRKFYAHFVEEHKLNDSIEPKQEKKLSKFFFALAKHGIIHKNSSMFRKGLSVISLNKNHVSLHQVSLGHVDSYKTVVSRHYDGVTDMSADEKRRLLYVDMRLFQMQPLQPSERIKIKCSDVIFISDDKAIVYIERKTLVESSIAPYRLMYVTGALTVALLKEVCDSGVARPFAIPGLEDYLKAYKKENFGSLSLSAINMTRNNSFIFNNSPLVTTIASSHVVTSPATLAEIDALYPDTVPDALMEKEYKRIAYALSRPDSESNILESDREVFSIEQLYKLQDLLQTKIPSEFRAKVPAVKSELRKYINDDGMTEHVKLIVQYILHLLEYDYEEMKNIKDSTFKGYIGLLDKHLFKKVEDLANVQEHELNELLSTLERLDYKHKSINKIRSLISRFFVFNNDEQRLQRVNISSYPKSLVFARELDGILSHIEAVTIGGAKRIGSTYKFKLLQLQALLLLGFYTGLRKTELRSRLLSDFYIYGDKLCIDVNKDGLKKIAKNLKTKNAKRRVCFSILDEKHFSIVKKFLETRKGIKNKSPFLFLAIPDDNIVRSKVIDETVFDEITQILQGYTSRYVSFHSLRHSYASYEVKEILADTHSDPQKLLDLAVRVGHEAPDITLKVYVHRSVLEMGGV